MRNIKAVIFDVGRVLVDIDPSREKFQTLLRGLGVDPDTAWKRFMYDTQVRRFATGEIAPDAFHRAINERFNADVPYDDFAIGWCDLFSPIPGMRELFEELAERYRMGLLSDTDPLHWPEVVKTAPWLARVEKPTLSFEVGYLKPHPKMFAAAAEHCGCLAGECLFVDDLVHNVDGARYHGMPAVQFTGVEKLRRDLAGLRLL